jgi:alpha-beta hydrolase superfamily lysophospholipase
VIPVAISRRNRPADDPERKETEWASDTAQHLQDPWRVHRETARVNGVTLNYASGGTGPAVVLLHGYPQTWYMWRKVMPALAEQYTVIAADLRGSGGSGTTSGAPSRMPTRLPTGTR